MLLTGLAVPYERDLVRLMFGDVIDDIVSEVEVLGILQFVSLQETVLIVGLIHISEIYVPHVQPFTTTARNLHPPLDVAYMPWGRLES